MRYVLCRLFFTLKWVLVAVLHLLATHFYEMKKTVETRTRTQHLHSYFILNKLIGSKIQNLKEKPHKKVNIFWNTLDKAHVDYKHAANIQYAQKLNFRCCVKCHITCTGNVKFHFYKQKQNCFFENPCIMCLKFIKCTNKLNDSAQI